MQLFVIWLIVGIGLLGLEMATGTMYLLFLGISALLGAAAAYAGLSLGWQVAVFALPALVSCIWGGPLTRRRRSPAEVSLDIGQSVRFERWSSREARQARVTYRGTSWDAEIEDGAEGVEGEVLYIVGVEGTRLKLAKSAARSSS